MPPVYALLTSSTDVTALVAARIYRHGRAPQDTAPPYITWSVVGGHSEDYLSGRPGIDQALVQVDCWSTRPQECKAIMEAVLDALEPAGYLSGLPMDEYDEVTNFYRYLLQFYFWVPR